MANSVVQIAGLALISDHSAKDSGVWRQCTVWGLSYSYRLLFIGNVCTL